MKKPLGNLGTLQARSLNRVIIMSLSLGCALGLAQTNQAATCVAAPIGLVSWWSGEGDALDSVGVNNGILVNGAGFAPGKVGQGFLLNGASQYIRVPDSASLDMTNEMTMELWYRCERTFDADPLFDKRNGSGPCNYGVILSSVWGVEVYYKDPLVSGGDYPSSGWQISAVTPPLPAAGVFHHFAMTYRQADAGNIEVKTYVDGALVRARMMPGVLARTVNNAPLSIGSEGDGAGVHFQGIIDEVSLYNRALSAAEIEAIYLADQAGKCREARPPTILTQPRNLAAVVGGSATMSVAAIGSAPLGYQWFFEGAALSGATGADLQMVNLQFNQSGAYQVVVSNVVGAVTSEVATVTVHSAPTCVAAPNGLVSWWSGEGNALDSVGVNNGTLVNGAGFAPGKVGQGFLLNGTSQYIRVPDSASLDMTNEMTMELWYRCERTFDADPLFDKRSGSGPCNYGVILSSVWGVEAYYKDPLVSGGDFPSSGWQISAVAPPLPAAGVFHHFAVTYRQADAGNIEVKTYVDGALVRARTMPGVLARTVNNASLSIGVDNGEGSHFQGIIDEVSLYNRALSAAEIEAIFLADQAGKCREARPPTILAQPRNVAAVIGGSATLNVVAIGSAPLGYQWFFEGAALAGATGADLRLAEVQASQAGAYQVVVSNTVGAVTSQVATVTVNPIPACLTTPADLAAWWGFDGNGDDLAGTSVLGFSGTPQFSAGAVGQAVLLSGSSGHGQAPASSALDLGASSGLSIEVWINPTDAAQLADLVEWNNRMGDIGAHLAISVPNSFGGGPGCLFANLVDTAGVSHQITSEPGLMSSGIFQHVGLTYDKSSGQAALYLDGVLVAATNLGSFTPQTSYDLFVGTRPSGPISGIAFNGLVDELSLYRRALAGAEMQAIHTAGFSGKCRSLRPPTIVEQPQSVTAYESAPVTFRVNAAGTAPLSYQWLRGDTVLADGTNATLVLPNVQASQVGGYSVVVTNSAGAVTSVVATLTVLPPASCVPVSDGLVAWWSLDGQVEDLVGTEILTLSDPPTYAAGKIGQGLVLDAFSSYPWAPVSPNLNIGQGSGMTIEAWINPADAGQMANLIEWNDGLGNIGAHLAISVPNAYGGGPGSLSANLVDTWGVSHQITSAPGALVSQVWQHVAVAYDKASGQAALFVNGNVVAVTNLGNFTPQTGYDLHLGNRPSGPLAGLHFSGMVDELCLYARALSANEIEAIAAAATAGKCKTPRPPIVFTPPQDVSVTEGGVAQFNVVVGGSSPLAYQWIFQGAAIGEATNTWLVLSNVQPAQAGSYAVVVSNPVGVVTSSVAVLAVRPTTLLPPTITAQPVGTSVAVGSDTSIFVTATGSEPLSYQWFWNGVVLSGANNAMLVLTNMQPGQAGAYQVLVSNYVGVVVSRAVVVNVTEYAGGTVNFANLFGTVPAYVYDVDGTTKLDGSAYLAQLYAGTNETTLLPVGGAVPFMSGNWAGLFLGGTRHIPSVPPGGIATVQVRAWEAAGGPTFEECVSIGGKAGVSTVFSVHTGGGVPPMPPTWLLGLQSFSLQASNVAVGLTNGVVVGDSAPVLLNPQLTGVGSSSAEQPQTAGLAGAPPPLPNGRFNFTIWGEVGKVYVIERSSDLRNWIGFTNVLNAFGPMQITDPTAGEEPQRFYRVRTQHNR